MATIDLGKIKLVNRGAYNNSTAYTVDDLVQSGGSTYICIQNSTGNAVTNGSYWSVLAQGGTDVGTTLTTQGDILYRDGSGLQRLAKGTAGKVLKMNTAANAPEWGDSGGLIIKKHAFYHMDQVENIANSGTLVLSQAYTTKGANSIFLLDASIYFGTASNSNSDVHNISAYAWLEDSGGTKYRFGMYKSSGVYASNAATSAGNYWLEDTDGTQSSGSDWNSQRRTYMQVGGNQTSDQTNYAASTFGAGVSLTFKLYLADGGGSSNLDYNRSHAGSNQHGRSFYCINELKGYE